MRTVRSDRFTSAFLARPNFAVRPFSSFWWSGKDGDDDDGGGGDEKDGKGDGGNKRNPSSSSSSSSSKRPRSGPLNVAGGSNVIDVESSSSSRVREGSSDNDGQGNDGQGSASDGDDDGLTDFERAARIVGMDVATVGEGEDAPRIRPLLVMPRSGSPIFPVPELAQHMLLQDEALVERLQRQLNTGVPYIGVFMRKDDDDAARVDDADPSEMAFQLSDLHPTGTLVQIAAIRELPVFDSGEGGGSDSSNNPSAASSSSSSSSAKATRNWHVLVVGHRRIRFDPSAPPLALEPPSYLVAEVDHIDTPSYDEDDAVVQATATELMSTIRDVLQTNEMLQQPVQDFLRRRVENQDPPRLADFAASLTQAKPSDLQQLLDSVDVQERLDRALLLLKTEVERSKLRAQIKEEVERKIGDSQRKFMLREQMKEIRRELGEEKDDKEAVLAKFRARLDPAEHPGVRVPREAQAVIDEEMGKLESLEKNSSEFNTTRNYLDWLTSVPWGRTSEENFDVGAAAAILDEDHYGMRDVKERILETIAVGRLKGRVGQGKIICLSGPPGTGKTSIGKSIARALNREFFRFSVGGLSDVAEIKGHRRTYVGAMPGKLIQCLKKTGTFNPLVLIDEIDKLGRGYKGDPASALLELLDPSQNDGFVDHYLDTPVDLSQVLFVCTANVLEVSVVRRHQRFLRLFIG
jgi:Lon-like ATP-dependent protease